MIIQGNMTSHDILKALNLKEHTLYKVLVKCDKNNLQHFSFLFVGFLTGSYTEVYNQTYDRPLRLIELYSIEIVEDLGSTNSYDSDEIMEGRPFDEDEELFPPDMFGIYLSLDAMMDSLHPDNNENVLP